MMDIFCERKTWRKVARFYLYMNVPKFKHSLFEFRITADSNYVALLQWRLWTFVRWSMIYEYECYICMQTWSNEDRECRLHLMGYFVAVYMQRALRLTTDQNTMRFLRQSDPCLKRNPIIRLYVCIFSQYNMYKYLLFGSHVESYTLIWNSVFFVLEDREFRTRKFEMIKIIIKWSVGNQLYRTDAIRIFEQYTRCGFVEANIVHFAHE